MKITKYLLGLAVVAMGLSACNTDVEGEYYSSNFENVSFEIKSASSVVPVDESTASTSVKIIRSNTADAYTVHYTATASEDGIFSDDANGVIEFAAGQNSATINIAASNLEKEVSYTYTLALSDADVESADTITSNQISVFTYTVQREGDWVSLGKGTYREDLLTTFWSVENLVYSLEIKEHETQKGIYRVMNPYGAAYAYNDPGDWDDSKDYYITINAQDPNYVYIEECELGVNWGYGMISIISYVQYFMDNGNDLATVKANRPDLFGKLEDGVITMPAKSILITMPDYNNGGLYYSNNNGLFAVALPGHMWGDYSAEVSYAGIFTNPSDEVFAVGNLTLGEDATDVKAVVVSQDADADAVADAIAAGDLEATDVEAGQIQVPIEEGLTGALQIVVVVLKGEDVKNVATTKFEYWGAGVNPWKSLGKGYLVDDFIITSYYETYDASTQTGTSYEPKTYEVEILESSETPGIYRIVNAFEGVTKYLNVSYTPANIDVNAEEPDGVYIPEQSSGIDDGDGDISIVTNGARYLSNYTLATLINAGYMGHLVDGVITFPQFTTSSGTIYQGICYQGTGGWYVGKNVAFKIILPSAAAQIKAKAKAQAKATAFAQRLNAYKANRVAAEPISFVRSKAFNKKVLRTDMRAIIK